MSTSKDDDPFITKMRNVECIIPSSTSFDMTSSWQKLCFTNTHFMSSPEETFEIVMEDAKTIMTLPNDDFIDVLVDVPNSYTYLKSVYSVLYVRFHYNEIGVCEHNITVDELNAIFGNTPEDLNGSPKHTVFINMIVMRRMQMIRVLEVGEYQDTRGCNSHIDGVKMSTKKCRRLGVGHKLSDFVGAAPAFTDTVGRLTPFADGICFTTCQTAMYLEYDNIVGGFLMSSVQHESKLVDLSMFISADSRNTIVFRIPRSEYNQLELFLNQKGLLNYTDGQRSRLEDDVVHNEERNDNIYSSNLSDIVDVAPLRTIPQPMVTSSVAPEEEATLLKENFRQHKWKPLPSCIIKMNTEHESDISDENVVPIDMPAAQNIRSDDTNSDLIEHGVNYNAVCGRDESYENVEFGNTHAGGTMLHEMSIGAVAQDNVTLKLAELVDCEDDANDSSVDDYLSAEKCGSEVMFNVRTMRQPKRRMQIRVAVGKTPHSSGYALHNSLEDIIAFVRGKGGDRDLGHSNVGKLCEAYQHMYNDIVYVITHRTELSAFTDELANIEMTLPGPSHRPTYLVKHPSFSRPRSSARATPVMAAPPPARRVTRPRSSGAVEPIKFAPTAPSSSAAPARKVKKVSKPSKGNVRETNWQVHQQYEQHLTPLLTAWAKDDGTTPTWDEITDERQQMMLQLSAVVIHVGHDSKTILNGVKNFVNGM